MCFSSYCLIAGGEQSSGFMAQPKLLLYATGETSKVGWVCFHVPSGQYLRPFISPENSEYYGDISAANPLCMCAKNIYIVEKIESGSD